MNTSGPLQSKLSLTLQETRSINVPKIEFLSEMQIQIIADKEHARFQEVCQRGSNFDNVSLS